MDLGLTETQRKAFRRAARNGDYHLLLGAGASRGSMAADGTPLPLGAQLAAMIADRFKVEIEDGDLLWRVYDRAMREAGEDRVYPWLRTLFWNVRPPSWMQVFARTPWDTVWTLNIDDSFEQAYAQVRSEASRSLRTVNWDDEFRSSRDLAVVHLHGCVDRDESPRELVFSLSEYARSAESKSTWPLNFRDIYGVSPFVVIGARLRDEPDIENVIANRCPTSPAPSLYVSPDISTAMEGDLRRWNLIPVRATAEEFAAEWPKLSGLRLDAPPSRREELSYRFGRQFKALQLVRTNNDHDFIGGDEPDWRDIEKGNYADLDWIRNAATQCRQLGAGEPAATAIVYLGKRLTGRTTGLLAIGRELRKLSWRPYLFAGNERLDIEAITQYAADGTAIALLFDSVADHAADVMELLALSRAADLKIACIAVDDLERSANIVGRIGQNHLFHRHVSTISSRLTKTDAAHLVDTLTRQGRLGSIQKISDAKRIAHFQHKELFDAMAQVEDAPGFGRRIDELIKGFDDDTRLDLLLLAALASHVNRRFEVIDAARMVGMESDRLVRTIQEDPQLAAVLKTDGKAVRTRHRWMALQPCIIKLGSSRSLKIISTAMNRVAPRLGRASQRERNSTSMLVGSMMQYKVLSGIFPDSNMDEWYESLANAFGSWSARYWEQRAIACRKRGQSQPGLLSKAESYAERAVSIVRDAYSLTTLGVTMLSRAAYSPGINVDKYYDMAVDAFQAASGDDPTNLVTWLAFLRYSLDLLTSENLKRTSEDRAEQFRDDWIRIYVQIKTVGSASDETKTDLERLKALFDARVQV